MTTGKKAVKPNSTDAPKTQSLSRKLFLSAFLLCGTFLIVQSLISYRLFYRAVDESFVEWDEHVLGVAKSSVETGLADMERYVSQISANDRIGELLCRLPRFEEKPYDFRELVDSICMLLNVFVAGYDGISSISLIHEGRWYRSDSSSWMPGEYGEEVMEAIDKADTFSAGVHMVLAPVNDVIRAVFMTPIGTGSNSPPLLVVAVEENWIGDLLGNSSGIIIYDTANHRPVYYSEFASDCHGSLGEADVRLREGTSERINGYRVTTTRKNDNAWIFGIYTNIHKSSRLLNMIIIIGVVCILLCLIVSLLTSRLLINRALYPINRLIRSFDGYLERGEPVQVVMTRRKHRFGEMLMLYLFSACVVPLLISVGVYVGVVNVVLEAATQESTTQYAEQSVSNLDALVEMLELSALRMSIDRNIHETIAKSAGTDGPEIRQINQVLRTAEIAGSLRQKRVHLSLYDPIGDPILSSLGESVQMNPEVLEFYQENNYPFSTIMLDKNSIRVYRRVISLLDESMHSLLGYLCIELSKMEFYDLFVGVEKGAIQTYIVYDRESGDFAGEDTDISNTQVLAYAKEATDTPRTIEDDEFFYTIVCAGIQDWVLIFSVDKRETRATARTLITTSTIMVLLMLCVVFWITYELSQRFSRSIEVLQYNLLISSKDRPITDLTSGIEVNEIHRIASSFNAMVARIRQLVDDSYSARFHELKMEADYRKAAQLALQSQINPHFLYNTLESMKFMVREGSTEIAVDMIDILGDLFRAAADDRTGVIELEAEVAYAKEYIRLQQLRYEDSLDVRFDIEDCTIAVSVPKLILQPILENAISHGRISDSEVMLVTITARAKGDTLVIAVENSGNTIEEERIQELQKRIDACDNLDGLGLVNANKRIRLYYGDDYGLTIANAGNNGIRISIRIPINTEET